MRGARALVAGCALWVLGVSCSDEGPITGPDIVFPATNVSYGAHVQPLFDQGCAFGGCHAADSAPSGLKLTSYDNLMFNPLQVVVREQPDESILILRVEGRLGRRMPLDRPALSQNQINGLRTWIAEGALNN